MNHQSKTLDAIDLFIEDIKTPNSQIRIQAKKQGCNDELTIYQGLVLNYLQNIRGTLQGNSKL